MASPGLDDLGARVIAIARALASGADPSPDQLKSLLPAGVGDRLQQTQDTITSTAAGLEQRARDQLASAQGALVAAEQAAAAQLQQTRTQLQQTLDAANADADRAAAAASAGLEQARATGADALQAATDTRDAALAQAEAARTQAQQAFDTALAQAQQLAADAAQAAQKAVADAEQAVQAALAEVASAVQRAQQAVDDALAAAQQLPGEVLALGQDTLERIEGALTWPSGILSLLAKVLIWLKKECFADVESLQVVWHEPADGPMGLGLQWLDGAVMLRLVYRPAVAPATGAGTLLVESTGADTVTFGSPDTVSVRFTGKAGQQVVVGKAVPAPQLGAGDLALAVDFGALQFNRTFGPLTARLDHPTITASLTHGETWGYDVVLALPAYGATLRLSDLLDQAGVSLPVSLPSIDELRSLQLEVDDGRFLAHEGASA